jgi:hypothetical protein
VLAPFDRYGWNSPNWLSPDGTLGGGLGPVVVEVLEDELVVELVVVTVVELVEMLEEDEDEDEVEEVEDDDDDDEEDDDVEETVDEVVVMGVFEKYTSMAKTPPQYWNASSEQTLEQPSMVVMPVSGAVLPQ